MAKKRTTSTTPQLKTFVTTFVLRNTLGKEVTVYAADEEGARREAMIELYGSTPDRVIPHAPEYKGTGLTLVSYA